MKTTKNRWLIALAAVGIHISIGSVYAWSVFTNPLIEQFGWGLGEVSLTFSIAIAFLGVSAAFMGHFVEKHGPRKSGMVAASFFGLGTLGAGLAVSLESLWLLYFSYGVLGGFGLGVGYITPVSTLVKWFPDRRGLATGLAIMGFGFASLVFSPIMNAFITSVGIAATFFILGGLYMIIMFTAALYLEPPPQGWVPAGFKEAKTENGRLQKQDLSQLTANEAVKTKRFWFLWTMLFINVTCGIAILAVASPMAQEITGMTAATAATMVGLMGLFNGLGRIGWASISDYIGRPNVYTAFFLIQIVAFVMLPSITHVLLFQVVLFFIMTCYGGGFASIPAYIGDLFGTKQLGAIHGYILTAWALAGLVGPMIASYIRETTNSYAGTLYIFTGMFIVALAVSLFIRVDIRQLRAQSNKQGLVS
ncbi:OFA family MFS transporter [Halalkalibacterium halodurans]|uniref:BH2528 protein n=2 Tax=Halalkalibacterium halodurans TaxID=86665 RepID=Q9K9W7_HALH5|nr:MFS transporter [Halalkalibacterium halodurans]MDY7223066.1 OFA family MFS transporter [Halalkalibacterium halodurans]MDY7242287.1 OFA family MFS transporter [Halalkalibacterium halodurans]MED3646166.1 OFA family MFS transporter [Halalkalibacterium halodurans]MED4079674.1 OFA family MFS transporter [Halalkalibacterium halodurans]MED4086384.1 OFA family MFS transporter [Halalkalibacterium halodurans]